MRFIITILLVLSLSPAGAQTLEPADEPTEAACQFGADAPETRTLAGLDGEEDTVQEVLCCCSTYTGGTCCNYAIFCGSIIPGCFCN